MLMLGTFEVRADAPFWPQWVDAATAPVTGIVTHRDDHIASPFGTNTEVRVAPSSGGKIGYALAPNGFERTLDGGATWQVVSQYDSSKIIGDPGGNLIVDSVDPMTVYIQHASTTVVNGVSQLFPIGRVLSVSEDGGLTWRESPQVALFGTISTYYALLTDPVQAGRIFFLTNWGRTFESDDRGRTWKRVANLIGDPSVVVDFSHDFPTLTASGDSRFIKVGSKQIEIRPGSFVLGSDLWWNPSESGRGLTITQHADGNAFIAWYAYDTTGNQVWRVMPDPVWLDSSTLQGTIYETRGPDYFGKPFDPTSVSVQVAGSATVHFDGDSAATFSYQLSEGTSGTTNIVREAFGAFDSQPMTCPIYQDYADLWWNESEPGWGLVVSQQYQEYFAAWFVYDANGHPQWVVMPSPASPMASFGGDCSTPGFMGFGGDVYATTGPPSSGPFDPTKVTATKVGTAGISFDGSSGDITTSATLRYTINGVSGTRKLTRQPF